MGFPGDAVGDPAALGSVLGNEAVEQLTAYLADQPTTADMQGLTDAERGAIADRRAWSLIRYLESLVESPKRP